MHQYKIDFDNHADSSVKNQYIITPIFKDKKFLLSNQEIEIILNRVENVDILSQLDGAVKMILISCNEKSLEEVKLLLNNSCYIEQERMISHC